ncbi:cysteine proteinase [Guyanagaster necrorhizus]|uniref:Cysteine proteinase n=1 Tax=Guyanagaster necrorhizus TaxID=856835 RepID=A0A9P7VWX9_9AGAR|nr:cysteine proteinase [Guyanagaster necrorhizus MCA 3950]KAG7447960.1 cysteine proteinase [Guyanagaster necrorhizus MCA 3950]
MPTPWAWVGTEVATSSEITQEHLLATCGLSRRNNCAFCRNRYTPGYRRPSPPAPDDAEDGVIVISDDEEFTCSKQSCKYNPNCLNYLGQELWEDEDRAREAFLKAASIGDDPLLSSRDPDIPVGLKNLGATCYANASLQVWFRDLAFRKGVYECRPAEGSKDKFKESPIFQLQVTFAALQEGTQSVFNPVKLVESLQLRTSEQQDAQEFSKLFMSHLDAEFKKQISPSLRSLLTDQFQGNQVYGTVCDTCGYKSERSSDFLEIELSFKNNAKLGDCIAATLQPEKLTGDNKYFCCQCDSHRDATRYVELRELPPVLHFSLLRFVYDVSTMERKKSKNAIIFPGVLNMNKFLGNAESRKSAVHDENDEGVYELRGVLLHKGASAYHGHYEAQVFDITTRSWYQFNDDVVTKIDKLGNPASGKQTVDLESDSEVKQDSPQGKKKRAKAARRKRVVDASDEEIDRTPDETNSSNALALSEISSKDAYMLIYAKREASKSEQGASDNTPLDLLPSSDVLEVVNTLNATHDEECETFSIKQKAAVAHFDETRHRVVDIYRSWSGASLSEDSVIVSQQALKKWLLTDSIAAAVKTTSKSQTAEHTDQLRQTEIPNDEIVCPHGRLDYKRSQYMKRITRRAYDQIDIKTYCVFKPRLVPSDVCRECVQRSFTERIYQIEHPRVVRDFEQVSEVGTNSFGYWISKPWLKDWKLAKPKMHTTSEGDPSPDAPEYDKHVRCEHGGLVLNTTSRTRISVKGLEILARLFPTWEAFSTEMEPCAVCEASIDMTKADRLELRKRAEDEKARLKHLNDNELVRGVVLLEEIPCVILPTQFLRSWRRWLTRPGDFPRPDIIDNEPFFCHHRLLIFDPNCATDMDSALAVVKRSDWDILETYYSAGPLITLVKESGSSARFVHDIPVCNPCRQKRKRDWESTDITIRFGKGSKPDAGGDSISQDPAPKMSGARQSKRLRQVKEHGERRKVTISKSTTVKDIKVMLQKIFNILPICQRIFYHGQELEDNTATAASLNIFANDILELREQNELYELSSDGDEVPSKRPRREEGSGFGGTLLGGSNNLSTSRERSETPPKSSGVEQKSCGMCTLLNDSGALTCTMCDTPFH